MKKTNKFKFWFYVMWINWYIQLFIINLIFLGIVIYLRDTFYSLSWYYICFSFFSLILLVIGYFGFYKTWKEINQYIQ